MASSLIEFHELHGDDDELCRPLDGRVVCKSPVDGDDRVVGDPLVVISLEAGHIFDRAVHDAE